MMIQKLSKGLIGVSLFLFYAGIFSLANIPFFLRGAFFCHIEQLIEYFAFPMIFIVLSFLTLGILGIASSIGIMLQQKWGWYLGCLYLIYGVARWGQLLVNVLKLETGNLFRPLACFTVFIFLSIVLFHKKRTDIFELTNVQKVKAFCGTIAISLVCLITTNIVLVN